MKNKLLRAMCHNGVAGWLYYAVMGGITLLNMVEVLLLDMEITTWNYVSVNIIVLMVLGSVWTTGRCVKSQRNLTELYRPFFERAIYGEERDNE